MHKLMEFTEDVCEMKEQLTKWLEEHLDGGKENVDTKEAGEVTDMIKDLAEAEEKAWKAMYYELICVSMAEANADEPIEHKGRYGYDRWRYASGRYAPKGHGRRSPIRGYTPGPEHWPTTVGPWMGDEKYPDYTDYRMGYPGEVTHNQTGDKMTTSYGRYKNARRHYTETGARKDKEEMDEHAMHHLTETAETLRDIWKNADPDMKRKMKTDISALLNEMQ